MQTVSDPIHGLIELSPLQQDLLKLPELQRLNWIRQLEFAFLEFPGAQHTRLQHSIGTSFIARKLGQQLKLGAEEIATLEAAGLLHDIAHLPFSHVLEPLFGSNHMDRAMEIVTGKIKMPFPNAGNIAAVLERHYVNPKEVANAINRKGTQKIINSIIHSEIDADQLDYLLRDTFFSNSTHGRIDLNRIINSAVIQDNEMVFQEKALDALESMLLARDFMYRTVYFHPTNRIAGGLLRQAFIQSNLTYENICFNMDNELLETLKNNPDTKPLIERILFKNLFDTAFYIKSNEAGANELTQLEALTKMGEAKIKQKILEKTNLNENDVLTELPITLLKITEPRLRKINIKIQKENNQIVLIKQLSPIAEALEKSKSTSYLFAVYCEQMNKDLVQKAVQEILGGMSYQQLRLV